MHVLENELAHPLKYRAPGKSMYFLLSRTQAGPGKTVKQEQEEISRNHVQTFSGCSVQRVHNVIITGQIDDKATVY